MLSRRQFISIHVKKQKNNHFTNMHKYVSPKKRFSVTSIVNDYDDKICLRQYIEWYDPITEKYTKQSLADFYNSNEKWFWITSLYKFYLN